MADISIKLNSNRQSRWYHHGPLLVVLFISMLPSTCSVAAVSITNLTVNDTATGRDHVVFEWDVVDMEAANSTVNYTLLSDVQLKYGFDWLVQQKCLPLSETTVEFDSLQPYVGYTACINVVRVNKGSAVCLEDSPRVTVNEACASAVTDFAPLSPFNLAALAVVGMLVIVLVVALIVNSACPSDDMNDKLDKKKMKAWSKKKRTESVHDFVQSFKSRSNLSTGSTIYA